MDIGIVHQFFDPQKHLKASKRKLNIKFSKLIHHRPSVLLREQTDQQADVIISVYLGDLNGTLPPQFQFLWSNNDSTNGLYTIFEILALIRDDGIHNCQKQMEKLGCGYR